MATGELLRLHERGEATVVLPAAEQSIPYDVDSSSFDALAEVSKNFPAWAWPLVLAIGVPVIWAKSPLMIGSGYALSILTEGRVEQQQNRLRQLPSMHRPKRQP